MIKRWFSPAPTRNEWDDDSFKAACETKCCAKSAEPIEKQQERLPMKLVDQPPAGVIKSMTAGAITHPGN